MKYSFTNWLAAVVNALVCKLCSTVKVITHNKQVIKIGTINKVRMVLPGASHWGWLDAGTRDSFYGINKHSNVNGAVIVRVEWRDFT